MEDKQQEGDNGPSLGGFLQILLYLALIIIMGGGIKMLISWAKP